MTNAASHAKVAHIAAHHVAVTDEAELIARELESLAATVREEATHFSPNPQNRVGNSEWAHVIITAIHASVANRHLSAFHHRAASLDMLIATEHGAREGWDEGRASVGEDMVKPIGEGGQREASTNPHNLPPVEIEGNLLDDVVLIIGHSEFVPILGSGMSEEGWSEEADYVIRHLPQARTISDYSKRTRDLSGLANMAFQVLNHSSLKRDTPTAIRALANARRSRLRSDLLGQAAVLS